MARSRPVPLHLQSACDNFHERRSSGRKRPLTSANTPPARFDTPDEHCETPTLMTLPEPGTGAPAPAATSSKGERRQPAWAKKVQRAQRVQRESPNDDGWLGAIELVTATFTWGGIGW